MVSKGRQAGAEVLTRRQVFSARLPRKAPLNRTVPLILAVALFMENMDSTVIATSLPAIAEDIGTSPVALKLALTAYLVSVAIFIPISGWAADRFGARKVFRLAIGVFVIGSIACATAGSLVEFVGARFLQGMGGAMMTPVGRLVLVRATAKRDLVAAMAWLTVPALLGPLAGPPLGGFITTYFSWHWIFLLNVPIGAAGIWLAGRFLPEIEASGARRLDLAGFLLAAVAAAGVVFGLSVVSLPALPPAVGLATLLLGVAAGFLYLVHARRTPEPILDPGLFRNRVFATAIASGSIFRVGAGAVPFLLPLLFQVGFGLNPFQSGMLSFATAIGALAMKFLAPFTLRAGGFRNVMIAAALLSACFLAANGQFTPGTPHGAIIAVLIGAGFLRSLFFTAANALVFAEIDGPHFSQATAISAASQQVTVAIGVAVGGGILEGMALFTGEPVGALGFTTAFAAVGAIAALAVLPLLSLPRNAGSAVSGHRLRHAGEEPTEV
jgi:EmrB/QacA subfamily drug resistance transporter